MSQFQTIVATVAAADQFASINLLQCIKRDVARLGLEPGGDLAEFGDVTAVDAPASTAIVADWARQLCPLSRFAPPKPLKPNATDGAKAHHSQLARANAKSLEGMQRQHDCLRAIATYLEHKTADEVQAPAEVVEPATETETETADEPESPISEGMMALLVKAAEELKRPELATIEGITKFIQDGGSPDKDLPGFGPAKEKQLLAELGM